MVISFEARTAESSERRQRQTQRAIRCGTPQAKLGAACFSYTKLDGISRTAKGDRVAGAHALMRSAIARRDDAAEKVS